jgi:hypothetical protein
VIPKCVQFIDGPALARTGGLSILGEEGSECYCILNKFTANQGNQIGISYSGCDFKDTMPRHIEIVGELCFCNNGRLESMAFRCNSSLMRTESQTFAGTRCLLYVGPP